MHAAERAAILTGRAAGCGPDSGLLQEPRPKIALLGQPELHERAPTTVSLDSTGGVHYARTERVTVRMPILSASW